MGMWVRALSGSTTLELSPGHKAHRLVQRVADDARVGVQLRLQSSLAGQEGVHLELGTPGGSELERVTDMYCPMSVPE